MQETLSRPGDRLESSRPGQASLAEPSIMTEAELTSRLWWFGRRGGAELVGGMRFLPDGTVHGAKHDNESHWRLQDGFLHMKNRTGHSTTIFDRWDTVNGRRGMVGKFVHDARVEHVLSEVVTDELRSLQWLTDSRTPLTVIFNDAGRPISGPETRWNFYSDTAGNPFDHIRYVEGGYPHFWYLNKVKRILTQIGLAVALGYREIGLYGSSSGGYASLLMGELVARTFRQCRVRTLTINPQTVHGASDEAAARQAGRNLRHEDMPIFIVPEVLAMAEVQPVNIRDHALREDRGDVEHILFYDGLNPIDSYYADQVSGLAGFHLVPVPLGVGHAAGINLIREQGAHRSAYEWLRFKDRSD